MIGFERLLYTDCAPGAGRAGGPGFQVQAQSDGVAPEQSRAAVAWLLYEAQQPWIIAGRDVADFPLGLAHASVEGWGTAQSRYLGKEVNGGRQGNHLTDCLITMDAAAYGPTRPAQLWGSPLWRDEPWPSITCQFLEEPPPLGPLTTAALAAWLRAAPGRAAAVAKLLTVLEDPDGPRVQMTATEPDMALRWIAAATLLLPMERAVAVSFKVFVAGLSQAMHRIAAVPKELNQAPRASVPGVTFVFDADTGGCDEVDVSERARFWVDRFVADGDPYDCVDALELAEAMVTQSGVAPADAWHTALVLSGPDPTAGDSRILARWLVAATAQQRADYGLAVMDRMNLQDLSANLLEAVDDAVVAPWGEPYRVAVRQQLLTAEISAVTDGAPARAAALSAVTLGPDALRDAESALTSALISAENTAVDALLTTAARHGVSPSLRDVSERLWQFVRWWADAPATRYDPQAWALGQSVLDLARAEVQDRVNRAGVPAVAGIVDYWWQLLLHDDDDLSDPLGCDLLVTKLYRTMRAGQEEDRLRHLLDWVKNCTHPQVAWENVQSSVMRRGTNPPAEAAWIVQILPPELPIQDNVIRFALDALRDPPRGTQIVPAKLRRALTARLQDITASDSREMLVSHQVFDELLASAASEPQGSPRTAALMADLVRRDLSCLGSRGPDLFWLLNQVGFGPQIQLLRGLPRVPMQRLLAQFTKEVAGGGPKVAARGFVWAKAPEVPAAVRPQFLQILDEYASSLNGRDRRSWAKGVLAKLPDRFDELWQARYLPEAEPGREGRRLWGGRRRG